jgi:hypothetical protein
MFIIGGPSKRLCVGRRREMDQLAAWTKAAREKEEEHRDVALA